MKWILQIFWVDGKITSLWLHNRFHWIATGFKSNPWCRALKTAPLCLNPQIHCAELLLGACGCLQLITQVELQCLISLTLAIKSSPVQTAVHMHVLIRVCLCVFVCVQTFVMSVMAFLWFNSADRGGCGLRDNVRMWEGKTCSFNPLGFTLVQSSCFPLPCLSSLSICGSKLI